MPRMCSRRAVQRKYFVTQNKMITSEMSGEGKRPECVPSRTKATAGGGGGNECFVEKLYRLADGRIHGSNRQRVVQSHLKHVRGNFVKFSKDEYQKFIVNWYLARLLNKKRFSAAYLAAVVETINRFYKIEKPCFRGRDVFPVVQNLRKIFNSESGQLVFFTRDCQPIQINAEEVSSLRENHKNLTERFSDKLFADGNFEALSQHNRRHLENFLQSATRGASRVPGVEDELALIVVFLSVSPRRINEILGLNMTKISELIERGMTSIQSKDGASLSDVVVPQQMSQILDEYVTAVGRKHQPTGKLFARTYFVYYTAMKRQYKSLFGTNIGRPFHGFRNYFAHKYYKLNPKSTRSALGHSNMAMTRRYAQKQAAKQNNTALNLRQFLTQHF